MTSFNVLNTDNLCVGTVQFRNLDQFRFDCTTLCRKVAGVRNPTTTFHTGVADNGVFFQITVLGTAACEPFHTNTVVL